MKRFLLLSLLILFFLSISSLAMPILPETPYERLFFETERFRWLAPIITEYKLSAWFATVEGLAPEKLYERLVKLGKEVYRRCFRS
ncbi:MAG: hypothetical protein J7M13_02255 [Synergistetes bacterium]|nr:hypothetical protein [Synergistota bacterium]